MPEQQALPIEQPVVPAAPSPEVAPAPAEGAAPAIAQDTAEQAPAAPPGGEEKKPDTDHDPEKRRESRRFERRMDKAVRRAAEAQARAELLEKELAKARQSGPAEADPAAPRIDQFNDVEAYAAAREKYAASKALKDHQTKQQTEAQKQATAKLVESWEEKVERASEKYEDFQAVVGDIQPTTPWAIAGMQTENGSDVFYHLGKNMAEARRIAGLPPVMQILEIGRLSQKLADAPAKPKTPSKAPAPITPVTGASTPSSKSIYDPNLPYDDFVKLRNKELGRKSA